MRPVMVVLPGSAVGSGVAPSGVATGAGPQAANAARQHNQKKIEIYRFMLPHNNVVRISLHNLRRIIPDGQATCNWNNPNGKPV